MSEPTPEPVPCDCRIPDGWDDAPLLPAREGCPICNGSGILPLALLNDDLPDHE